MSAVDERAERGGAGMPALWQEPAAPHFDAAVAWWVKAAGIVVLTAVCIGWVDGPVAAWALRVHPIPDLAEGRGGDIGREFMMLEQWGQWVCSVLVIGAVALLDKKEGWKRSLAIAIGCLCTVAVSYLLKDLLGRSRPYVAVGEHWPLGSWVWGGAAMGFHKGSAWQSFPSSHTTGAFALSVGLAWCYPRGRALFMGLATFTAVQRVLHGAHFVSDTVAGMGMAVLITRWTFRARLAGRVLRVLGG